jgi:S-adenosylmethionine-diacylglycerol 3-amino-3-carboxypropyl transferase
MERLLFAVTREDPELELALAAHLGVKKAICIGSGGCTPLALLARIPETEVAAFDINPSQLAHIHAKWEAARSGDMEQLCVGRGGAGALNQKGEFEGLFRLLRQAFLEFVAPREEVEEYFSGESAKGRASHIAQGWLRHHYWPAAFQIAFNDPFLHLMFTERATQNAEPNSYPGYFQAKIEKGLQQSSGPDNPFLQHIFLGHYRKDCAPAYALHPPKAPPLLREGGLEAAGTLSEFQLASLSNVFDWSEDLLVRDWFRRLEELPKGAAVVIRQLNNGRELESFHGSAFYEDRSWDLLWREKERSLFYDRYRVLFRQ